MPESLLGERGLAQRRAVGGPRGHKMLIEFCGFQSALVSFSGAPEDSGTPGEWWNQQWPKGSSVYFDFPDQQERFCSQGWNYEQVLGKGRSGRKVGHKESTFLSTDFQKSTANSDIQNWCNQELWILVFSSFCMLRLQRFADGEYARMKEDAHLCIFTFFFKQSCILMQLLYTSVQMNSGTCFSPADFESISRWQYVVCLSMQNPAIP